MHNKKLSKLHATVETRTKKSAYNKAAERYPHFYPVSATKKSPGKWCVFLLRHKSA